VARLRVVLDPRAEADARQAFLWYAGRSPVAGADFQALLTEAIEDLAETALAWPEKQPGVRARVLDRYPYTLFYRVAADEVLIVAVAHQKRGPGYWRRGAP
jgi:plasmid stabilization system protein ParE